MFKGVLCLRITKRTTYDMGGVTGGGYLTTYFPELIP